LFCGIRERKVILLTPWAFFLPTYTWEWESDGAEDEDSALALLDAIEEDFHRGSMGKRYKIKGRREL